MKRILTTLKEKWPEYLLEIFVIVLSIFGGLELENWNENRQNQNKENQYLQHLLADAKKDSIFYQQRFEMFKEADSTYSHLIRLTQGESIDSSKINNEIIFQYFAFQSKLVSNNEDTFDKVTNTRIKALLRDCFQQYEYVFIPLEVHNRAVETVGRGWVLDNYSVFLEYQEGNLNSLKGNLSLQAVTSEIRSMIRTSSAQVEIFLGMIHELTKELEKELNKS